MTSRPSEGALAISLTLPGSASLGAYQAGALSALAVMITTLRHRGLTVRVDAIGGSSAGSIVSTLFAYSLLTGSDAPSLLRRAWVEEVDAELLRGGLRGAPLGFDDVRRRLAAYLDDHDRHPTGEHQPIDDPITVQVGLTSLLGFVVDHDDLPGYGSTLTYADWAEFDLNPNLEVEDLFSPEGGSLVDAMLASASHPATFAPSRLDRSDAREAFEAKGITNVPDNGRLWYTDGGLVETEPIGRVIRAATARARQETDHRRLHLVVDPRSSEPDQSEPWSEGEDEPTWVDGLSRSLSILPTQALHDDLRSVLEVNERLARLDEICERRTDDEDSRQQLRKELADAFGLTGKERVEIDMVTPLLLTGEDERVSDLLAGDIIGTFGGFLSQKIRRSDFQLGWSCTESWIEHDLEDAVINGEDVDAVLDAIDEAGRSDDEILDDDGTDVLGRGERWQLALIAASAGYNLAREAVPVPRLRLTDVPLISRFVGDR